MIAGLFDNISLHLVLDHLQHKALSTTSSDNAQHGYLVWSGDMAICTCHDHRSWRFNLSGQRERKDWILSTHTGTGSIWVSGLIVNLNILC